MGFLKIVYLAVLLGLAAANEESATRLRDRMFAWSDVAIFVAGCAALMILIIGVSFLVYEHSCRQYFREPAAEYYRQRGDLPVVNDGETTRL